MKNRLRDIREDNDLEQKQVANKLGISQQYYSRYELGQVEMPIRHYITLAKYYNISIDYLTGTIEKPRTLKEDKDMNCKSLSEKQKKLLKAYSENPKLQAAIDKLLDLGD